jgi:hypothetical protein
MLQTRLAPLALALALMLGTAGPALAQDDARGRCIREAARAGLIGRDLNPGRANFVVGTDGPDDFTGRATTGRDVFCGFDGNDSIRELDEGDVLLGGAGIDVVDSLFGGTLNGGDGDDRANILQGGTFNGGSGDDSVTVQSRGTFNGGDGVDRAHILQGGTFNGGEGFDHVALLDGGTFNGGGGDDGLTFLSRGTFNGGPGNDHCGILGAAAPAIRNDRLRLVRRVRAGSTESRGSTGTRSRSRCSTWSQPPPPGHRGWVAPGAQDVQMLSGPQMAALTVPWRTQADA